jgi:hypothetical protein
MRSGERWPVRKTLEASRQSALECLGVSGEHKKRRSASQVGGAAAGLLGSGEYLASATIVGSTES